MLEEEIVSCFTDLGLEVGKTYFKGKIDELKLEKSLSDYLEREWSVAELYSLSEEIDFEGLANYLKGNCLNKMVDRFFSCDSNIRKKAYSEIISISCSYASANTDEQKKVVIKIVNGFLDVLYHFYKIKIKKEEWLLSQKIVDETNNHNDENTKLIRSDIEKLGVYSPEKLSHLAACDDYDKLEQRLVEQYKIINTNHPLQPYYGFELRDMHMISVPLIDEALEKYPPKIICTGSVQVGDKIFTDNEENYYEYAYRHQKEIIFNVETAKKMLGDYIDPRQYEAEELEGKILITKPKAFPPAQAYKILIDETVYYEYVLLRLQEIEDDNTFIFSNKEQSSYGFHILIRYNFTSQTTSYVISMENLSNEERLKYVRFMQIVSQGGVMDIVSLDNDASLLTGKLNPIERKTGFKNIEEEKDFFERIVDIEKFFKLSISVPNRITYNEYKTVEYLSELVRGNEYKKEMTTHYVDGVIDDGLRSQMKQLNDVDMDFWFIGPTSTVVFGTELKFPLLREYIGVRIKDLDRLKKKIQYSDDGEDVRLVFEKGLKSEYIDRLYIAGEDKVG